MVAVDETVLDTSEVVVITICCISIIHRPIGQAEVFRLLDIRGEMGLRAKSTYMAFNCRPNCAR
jgi:hypothetical protein